MGFEFQSQTFDKWAQIQIVVELERGRTITTCLKPARITWLQFLKEVALHYGYDLQHFLPAFEMLEWYV